MQPQSATLTRMLPRCKPTAKDVLGYALIALWRLRHNTGLSPREARGDLRRRTKRPRHGAGAGAQRAARAAPDFDRARRRAKNQAARDEYSGAFRARRAAGGVRRGGYAGAAPVAARGGVCSRGCPRASPVCKPAFASTMARIIGSPRISRWITRRCSTFSTRVSARWGCLFFSAALPIIFASRRCVKSDSGTPITSPRTPISAFASPAPAMSSRHSTRRPSRKPR